MPTPSANPPKAPSGFSSETCSMASSMPSAAMMIPAISG